MTTYQTEYGSIRRDEGVCKDDYGRLVTYEQPGGRVIILQRAAMRSFQLAEEAYGRRPWMPGRPRKIRQRIDREVWGNEREGFRRFRPIFLTGSIRSCAMAFKYYSLNGKFGNPPNRYAHPSVSLHPHGLAVDVDTGWLKPIVRILLKGFGWNQSRPESEPWHFSYFLTA